MKNETTLANQSLIQTEKLNPALYTISLFQEGLRAGLIDRGAIGRIQGNLMLIVKDLILRYTGGDSSSVKLETAEAILGSVYYAIDACVSNDPNPEAGLELLKTKGIREIYQQGLEQVTVCVAETKQLFEKVRKGKLAVGTEAYLGTIEEDLPEFFATYGVVFGAQDTTCAMDYPLVFDDQGLTGIFYIRQYLEKLELETEFCRLFREADLEKVLANYGRIYRMSYRQSLLNIFELVFNNAVFAVLAGAPAGELRISEAESKRLQKQLRNIDRVELEALVRETVAELIGDLRMVNPRLLEYMARYQTVFLERVSNALENDSLYNMILSDAPQKRAGTGMIFEAGPKMQDADFRRVLQEVRGCSSPLDKVVIIRTRIHSVEDFVDLLQTDCLIGDEFGVAFGAFSEMELAVMGRIVFEGDLRNGPLNLAECLIRQRENGEEWQGRYINFIRGLGKERIAAIERLINVIEENTGEDV
ncbi:MAG TPA: DUF6179 domain-containing protein [Bacillota bacterium]|nr:DUF6179 domain-containing protein [Bacillota bacterium]